MPISQLLPLLACYVVPFLPIVFAYTFGPLADLLRERREVRRERAARSAVAAHQPASPHSTSVRRSVAAVEV